MKRFYHYPTRYWLFVLFILISALKLGAVNVLTVQNPNVYGEKPGFIDKATLVIEPHGAFVEQSLYVKYADRAQYIQGQQLEVVHRFELPQQSVVNDLWLWIGDSVMQAIMLDTWTARAIYDSIVDVRRDPAFLSQKGSQYELHVYPLESGSYRKIKLNYLTPTQWAGEEATAPLPLRYLQATNAALELAVLFRIHSPNWAEPELIECPELQFEAYTDTLGYHYLKTVVPDIKTLSALTVKFNSAFTDGYFLEAERLPDKAGSYYQLGFSPKEFFNLHIDSSAQKIMVGIDLSGNYNKKWELLRPNLEKTLLAASSTRDSLNFVVTGAGKVQPIREQWVPATPAAISGMLTEFEESTLGKEILTQQVPHILYADNLAARCWSFPGIEDLATTQKSNSIITAIPYFQNADIIAGYRHGYEDKLTAEQLSLVTASLDTVFRRGGRMVSFYDYNRVNRERLATYYIPGLTTHRKIYGELKRNPDGNIGSAFPEAVYCNVVNQLEWDEAANPDVKIELMDNEGRAAIISKKIHNGLLVVSGIWAFQDDGGIKAQIGAPLLGLNQFSTHRQLDQLLATIQGAHNHDTFNQALIFSNADSLITLADGAAWLPPYLAGFNQNPPIINTVNVLDGTSIQPASFSADNIDYFGSGYFLNQLASATGGLHFETHLSSWEYIQSCLAPFQIPIRENFIFDARVDGGTGVIAEQREVAPIPNDARKPVFFIGETNGTDQLDFTITGTFNGDAHTYIRDISTQIVTRDTTRLGTPVIPSMLAYERLMDLFESAAEDTAAIVALALEYNLMCDYTSLLALEPNDTLKFMQDPLDEDELTAVLDNPEFAVSDSLEIDIYPNPFNARATISFNLAEPQLVNLVIYNIRGRIVKQLLNSQLLTGRQAVAWDGHNRNGEMVSSGVYFARAVFQNPRTNEAQTRFKQMILLK